MAETKVCEECSNYVHADRDRCLSCRRRAPIDESIKSPDVAPDGSIDYGDNRPDSSTPSDGLGRFLPSVSPTVLFTKGRSLFVRILLVASFGLVLVGVYLTAVGYRAVTNWPDMTLHGVTIPDLAVGALYFRPDEVLVIVGVIVFMTGIAIIAKLTFTS